MRIAVFHLKKSKNIWRESIKNGNVNKRNIVRQKLEQGIKLSIDNAILFMLE
jgi:hypothetical protein